MIAFLLLVARTRTMIWSLAVGRSQEVGVTRSNTIRAIRAAIRFRLNQTSLCDTKYFCLTTSNARVSS